MLRKRKELDGANFIFGREAAKILGMHRDTFRAKVKHRKYDNITIIRNRLGPKYLIQDIFKIAHPSADNKLIESMVYNWRLKKTLDTKRGRKK